MCFVNWIIILGISFMLNMHLKKQREKNNQTSCGPGVNIHKSTELPPLT